VTIGDDREVATTCDDRNRREVGTGYACGIETAHAAFAQITS